MSIAIIAALGNQRVIGYQNQLPWHLPADFKHLKLITMGKPIIMGRKTYESIGKPLPGRTNVIVTRNTNYQVAGCVIVNSLAQALQATQAEPEVIIFGGTEIFKQALPLAQRLYLTWVHADFVGDTFFPAWNEHEWCEIERQDFKADEKNSYDYSFVTLDRN